MKNPVLQNLTTAELVENFKQLSFRQAEAEGHNDSRTYNECFDRLKELRQELKRRGPEARRALVPLLDCPGSGPGPIIGAPAAQCRYNAAHELLVLEPAPARAALNLLAKKGPSYQQFKARRTLACLDTGSLDPT